MVGAHGLGSDIRAFGRGLREMSDGTTDGKAAAEIVGEVILMIRKCMTG